jgi:hypothetical protein
MMRIRKRHDIVGNQQCFMSRINGFIRGVLQAMLDCSGRLWGRESKGNLREWGDDDLSVLSSMGQDGTEG